METRRKDVKNFAIQQKTTDDDDDDDDDDWWWRFFNKQNVTYFGGLRSRCIRGFGFIACRYSTPRAHCRVQLTAWAAVYGGKCDFLCRTAGTQNNCQQNTDFPTVLWTKWRIWCCCCCSYGYYYNDDYDYYYSTTTMTTTTATTTALSYC